MSAATPALQKAEVKQIAPSPYAAEKPRLDHLYASGPIVSTILRGLATLTWVLATELVWDLRYNPQWTRFYK